MTGYQALLSRVLKDIRPSTQTIRTIEPLAKQLVAEIQELLDRIAAGCRVQVEGSVAKGTYLEGQHDIDIFAFFPVDTPRAKLEEATLDLGRRWAEGRGAEHRVAYAEHPYVTVKLVHEGLSFDVDVVGAYLVDSTQNLKSAVDRTRFHTQYIKSRMTPRLRDQVLLTKRFMRGTKVYGSEVRVGGFSGLLCEVLTIAHGSFLDLLRGARDWSRGHVIDVEGLCPSATEDFDAPLIVIDPTDGGRNAGAAVSVEKMTRFIHAARSFMDEPSERFFFPRPRKPYARAKLRRILEGRRTRIFVLEFAKPDVIDDIIYPQMERMVTLLRGQLEDQGFVLSGPRSGAVVEGDGMMYVLLELAISSLPNVEKRYGPTVDRAEHARKFLLKHSQAHPYLEGDRWCVDAPRRFSDAEDLLRFVLRDNPQDILPSHVARALKSGWKIRSDDDAIGSAGRQVRLMLTEHFEGVFPWDVR